MKNRRGWLILILNFDQKSRKKYNQIVGEGDGGWEGMSEGGSETKKNEESKGTIYLDFILWWR